MPKNYSNIEDFILNSEIPSFRKYLELAPPLEKKILIKSLLILINSNARKSNILLPKTNLPAICYLSHDGFLEVSTPNNFLSSWFNIEEFHLNLNQHNLPKISGFLTNNKLRLELSQSPVKWSEMRQITNYAENYYLSFDETKHILGKVSTETAGNLESLNLESVKTRICFIPLCRDFQDFKNKCQTYKIELDPEKKENNLPFQGIKKPKSPERF